MMFSKFLIENKMSGKSSLEIKELTLEKAIFRLLEKASLINTDSSTPEERDDRAIFLLSQIFSEIKAKGKSINDLVFEKVTPLNAAIAGCSSRMVKFLLENGANPETELGEDSPRPLTLAIQQKEALKVKALLDHGANPNGILDNGLTPLLMAISNQDQLSAIEILTNPRSKDVVDLRTTGNYKVNLLALSILYQTPDVTKCLLASDNLDMTDFILFYCHLKARSEKGDASSGVDWGNDLTGKFLDAISGSERASLAAFANFDTAQLLPKQSLVFAKEVLTFRALCPEFQQRGISAALIASDDAALQPSTLEKLKILCGKQGPNQVSPQVAIKYAFTIIKTSRVEAAGDETERALIKDLGKLFDAGLIPNAFLPKGVNIGAETLTEQLFMLHGACQFSSPGVIEFLVSKGCNINQETPDTKTTPLHSAVTGNKLDVVKKLVSLGADVNVITVNTTTPLIMSICRGFNDISEFLLSLRQVNVNLANNNILTPLAFSLLYNRPKALEGLLARKDLKFEHLSEIFEFFTKYASGLKCLTPNTSQYYLQQNLELAMRIERADVKTIMDKFKKLDIPVSSTSLQHLDFAKEMLGINKKTAFKHLEIVSKLEIAEESAEFTKEATTILIKEYSKDAVTKGYALLFNAVKRAEKQGIAEPLIEQLTLLKTIAAHETNTRQPLGRSILEIISQRKKLAEAKLKNGIPPKKTFEECSDALEALRLLTELEKTDLEKYLLKITDPVRKAALEKLVAKAEEKSVIQAFRSQGRNIEPIKKSFLEINELFKIIAEELEKQDIQNIEMLYGKSLSTIITKYSVAMQSASDIAIISELEAFKMFGVKPVIKASMVTAGGAASSVAEAGGVAAGSSSASASEAKETTRDILDRLAKFAANPSSREFDAFKAKIDYKPVKGDRKSSPALKQALEAPEYKALKTFLEKNVFEKVSAHFIMAFLKSSTDETLQALYQKAYSNITDGGTVVSHATAATEATMVSTDSKLAAFEEPVSGVGALAISAAILEGDEHESESCEDDKSGDFEGIEFHTLTGSGSDTLGLLFYKNFKVITHAGLASLLNDLSDMHYSYELKKGKYVIRLPNGETIGGHDLHAQDVKAGREGGAIIAIASLKALRDSLMKAGIFYEFGYIEEGILEASHEPHLKEYAVTTLIVAEEARLQAIDLFKRIADGHAEHGDVESLPNAYAALGLKMHHLLQEHIENGQVVLEQLTEELGIQLRVLSGELTLECGETQ